MDKELEIIKEEFIDYKNPGTGIPYKDANKVLGKVAKINIPQDTLLEFTMFK